VPTEDGQHHRISDDNLAAWVEALVCTCTHTRMGEFLTSLERQCAHSVSWRDYYCTITGRCSDPSYQVTPSYRAAGSLQAVSIPPSRRRDIKSSTFAATASLRESVEKSSISEASSGVPGPGYYSGKALKSLGETSLSALEDFIILMRRCQQRYHLKIWEKLKGKLGMKGQKKFFKILGDVLEMSR
jgi:hypothetical protein